MEIAGIGQAVPSLTEGQARALALKMEAFWSELSPAEQAQVNRALGRMGDDSPDVAGQAGLAEYGFLLSLIAVLI